MSATNIGNKFQKHRFDVSRKECPYRKTSERSKSDLEGVHQIEHFRILNIQETEHTQRELVISKNQPSEKLAEADRSKSLNQTDIAQASSINETMNDADKPSEEELMDTREGKYQFWMSKLYSSLHISDSIRLDQTAMTPELNGGDVIVPEAVEEEAMEEVEGELCPLITTVTNLCTDEARSETTFRFVVENVSKLKEQVLSPPVFVRNLPWRIMAMPRTNHSQERQATRSLGFFLQCNGDSDSTTWSCHATAELKLIPQKEGIEPLSRKIQHVFYGKENDWGFSHFQTMSVSSILI